MVKLTQTEIAKILDKHGKWLDGERGGKRATFTDVSLVRADFHQRRLDKAVFTNVNMANAYLRGATLTEVVMKSVNLFRANLTHASFAKAKMAGCCLRDTRCYSTDFGHANLAGVDFRRANMQNAILRNANLNSANMREAELNYAYLTDSSMLSTDLTDADLSNTSLDSIKLTGAILVRANLSNTYTHYMPIPVDLSVTKHGLKVPVVKDLDAKILAAVSVDPDALCMASWHDEDVDVQQIADTKKVDPNWCMTTHCRAGHAINFAGIAGYELEAKLGPALAGGLIYKASAGYIPNFYATTSEALQDIRKRAKKTKRRTLSKTKPTM